ncbi:MAG: hypothetical protein ACP5VE_01640 [Chthonomonadales bacterium]
MQKPLSSRAREAIYLSTCLCLAAALGYFVGLRFEPTDLPIRALDSFAYFGIAAAYAIAYCVYSPYAGDLEPAHSPWTRAIFGGILMILAADLAASWARQDVVLVVLPSLFSLPGAAIGAALALAYVEREYRREAPAVSP